MSESNIWLPERRLTKVQTKVVPVNLIDEDCSRPSLGQLAPVCEGPVQRKGRFLDRGQLLNESSTL